MNLNLEHAAQPTEMNRLCPFSSSLKARITAMTVVELSNRFLDKTLKLQHIPHHEKIFIPTPFEHACRAGAMTLDLKPNCNQPRLLRGFFVPNSHVKQPELMD